MSVFEETPDAAAMPTTVRRDGDAVVWEWDDGSQTRWTASQLRRRCPCATCREKRRGQDDSAASVPGALPVLSAAEAAPLRVETLRPSGNYAYNVVFSDGHSSGLFTLAMLHEGPPSPRDK